jgi:hypothetical protein
LINIYVRERKVPTKLALATKDYFHHCRSIFRSGFYSSVFDKLSPQLQGQLAQFEHAAWIGSISFFNAEDEKERTTFVHALSRVIILIAFSPAEEIYHKGAKADAMFSIFKGLVGTEHRVLYKGKCFGVEMILASAVRVSNATAFCFADVYRLTHTTLMEVLGRGSFPETERLVRHKSLWIAVKMKFIYISGRLRDCEGYAPKTIAYKQRVKRYYARLAQDRAQRRGEVRVGMDEVVESTKVQLDTPRRAVSVESDTTGLAQLELDYLTNGSKEGYVLPKQLKEHLSEQNEREFAGSQATQQYRSHVKGALRAIDQRIDQLERCTSQTQQAVAQLVASLAPSPPREEIVVLEDA